MEEGAKGDWLSPCNAVRKNLVRQEVLLSTIQDPVNQSPDHQGTGDECSGKTPPPGHSSDGSAFIACCLLGKVLRFCILPLYTFDLTGRGMLNGLAVVFGLCLKKSARARNHGQQEPLIIALISQVIWGQHEHVLFSRVNLISHLGFILCTS